MVHSDGGMNKKNQYPQKVLKSQYKLLRKPL